MMEPHYRHLKCSPDRGVLVLTITEALVLDEEIADTLRQDFIAAVEYHKLPHVVICFTRVRSVSSVIFRPLISVQRRVQSMSGRLLLCCLTGMPAEVFRITGLIGEGDDAPFETEDHHTTAVVRLTKR
jgi:anti-anti-sigma factor